MIRYVLFIILLFCACKGSLNKKQSYSSYPAKIDSLGLQHLYDETKWRLYCYYCDDTIGHRRNTNNKVTYGELDLEYKDMDVIQDSTLLVFLFDVTDIDIVKYEDDLPRHASHYDYCGILYVNNTVNAFYGHTFNGFYRQLDTDSRSRYYEPLQPEVVTYIKTNKDKINPWFRNEAIKRGILKEGD